MWLIGYVLLILNLSHSCSALFPTKQGPDLFRDYFNKAGTKQGPELFRDYFNKERTKQESKRFDDYFNKGTTQRNHKETTKKPPCTLSTIDVHAENTTLDLLSTYHQYNCLYRTKPLITCT